MEFPASLRDRYRPDAPLGQGGFGTVLRCQDLSLNRPVAVKLLDFSDAELVARFEREARVTAGLRDPHIVEVYDHGVSAEGVPWIAYELIEGHDLSQAERPGDETLTAWAKQGAKALAVVHDAGLVHRDVKPGNFLVRADDGRLVLVDFGIVRSGSKATVATAAGIILGTPAYMAPELFDGVAPSPASDQFAWAATLLEVGTGRPLFPDPSPAAVIEALRHLDPGAAVPATVGPPGFATVLQQALSLRPDQRFASMRAFREALSRESAPDQDTTVVIKDGSTAAASTAPLRPTPVRGTTTPSAPPLWVLSFLLIVGVALGIRFGEIKSPRPTPPIPAFPAIHAPELTTRLAAFQKAELALHRDLYPKPTRTREAQLMWAKDPEFSHQWIRFLGRLREVVVRVDLLPHSDRVQALPQLYAQEDLFWMFQAVHSVMDNLRSSNILDFKFYEYSNGIQQAFEKSKVTERAMNELAVRHKDVFDATQDYLDAVRALVPNPSPPLKAHLTAGDRFVRSQKPGHTFLDSLSSLPFEPPTNPQMNQHLLYRSLREPLDLDPPFRCDPLSDWLPGLDERIKPFLSEQWAYLLPATSLLIEASTLVECPAARTMPGASPRFVARLHRATEAAALEKAKNPSGLMNLLNRAHQQTEHLYRLQFLDEGTPLRLLSDARKQAQKVDRARRQANQRP